ncbi:MAG TPA: YihY/virulence factor BrkB family protein [Gemmataceae bacterium]|jgi:membrane protein
MNWKDLVGLVRETIRGWSGRQTFQLGAALAFYAAFALAPTLVLAVALAGVVFGDDAAQGRLTSVLRDALGPTVSQAVTETLTYVHLTRSGWTASWVGFGLILFAATALFTQLQLALNAIWEVRPKPGRGLWVMVRNRFLAFLLVLGTGALLLVSLTTNSVLIVLHDLLPAPSAPRGLYLWDGLNWLTSLGLMTLLLAMIFKLLPDAVITWRDVVVGAFITAVLFGLGNYLICQYLCRFAAGGVYGAAGSLTVVMLWVYYSSQILLFGAEFTRHFADRHGEPIRPAAHAMCHPT